MIGLLSRNNGFVEVKFFIFDNKILIVYPEELYFGVRLKTLELSRLAKLIKDADEKAQKKHHS
jgi:hypothetical protein